MNFADEKAARAVHLMRGRPKNAVRLEAANDDGAQRPRRRKVVPLTPGEYRYLRQYLRVTKVMFDTNSPAHVAAFRSWLNQMLSPREENPHG